MKQLCVCHIMDAAMCLPTYYSMYFPMRRHLCNLMAETGVYVR